MRTTTWTTSDRGRTVAAGYLVLQAVLGALWWAALFVSSDLRAHFELMVDEHSGLNAFLLADWLVVVGGSLAAAVTIWRRSRWATLAAAFVAGGIVYAALYLAAWVRLEGTAAMGLAPMGLGAIASFLIAVGTVGADGSGADG